MKLIFINRFFYPDHSATSQILTDLAFDLATAGHEVHVVASRQLYENPSAMLGAEDEANGVKIHRIRTSRFGRANLIGRAIDYATFYAGAGLKLFRLARRGDVLIAKTDPPLISVVAAFVARIRGALLINWLQDVFPEVAHRLGVKIMRGRLGSIASRLRNYSLRAASFNVVLGERMARYVRALPGLDPARIAVIENWSDGALIRPLDRSRNPLRNAWGLADRFVVGYSGNMGRAHEFDTVLGAAELLKDDRDIVFLFIGAGRQREWIESESEKRLLGNVIFQPYQPRERLTESLSAADVHLVTLQPSLEGLIVPSKYYGIAAAGRAAIFVGDPLGEIGTLVTEGACGAALPTGDSTGLARTLRDMKSNLAATLGMGARARQIFEARNDRPVALKRWTAVLRNLAEVTRG